ncbi:DUF5305 family protein [Psychrobacillus sp. FSL K6-1464]|uniref:DUF5305 family protein n=1 Tax=Psychrobacillus sp. FSL K6-1464 TaxID=2921545 RepID=UPI0030FC3611
MIGATGLIRCELIAQFNWAFIIRGEGFRISKEYGKRIITVTQKMTGSNRSIINLNSFKSILQLADEKKLPIFLNKNPDEGRPIFFIVEGNYVYSYESAGRELVRNTTTNVSAFRNVYAES